MDDDPDDVVRRLTEVTLRYMDRLTAEEMGALDAGDITLQEALDLSDEEHGVLLRELGALAIASEELLGDGAVLELVLKRRNDGKGLRNNDHVTCGQGYGVCLIVAAATSVGPSFAIQYFIKAMVCLCTYCKGGYVAKVCG